LYNAPHFSTLLAQAQARGLEQQQQGALLCLDIDDFKSVNDALGRDQGDALLRQLAQRITQVVGSTRTVARLGGDQFLVLLENLPPVLAAHDAQHLAERLQHALAEPVALAGVAHHASASLGILVWGESYQEPQELLRRVVLALNQAKNAGAGSILFFEPQMQDQVSGRARLQRCLREALQKQSFALHYQPQLDAAGQVVGVEALLRWHLPGHGPVSPAEFIPLAEKTGLIMPLGRWVLHQACSQLAAWAQKPTHCHLTMAVNVSADQFRQEDFVQQVQQVLAETGAPAPRLKLELTESLMMHDTEQVIARMNALRQLGLRFSLDDFGTGFSSLAYLKRLPLAQLKIDQSFVRDLLDDANDAVIAQTIIALGLSLGLEVIAEGVETQAHRDLLDGWGCRYYQGYFFSRPLPLRELEDYLRTQAAAAANT
ncbi:MAG: bifunctional diguanylate cyclase/phosphodiesterase, partial [Comamonadaceae bacterium]|nr:bifunctional diguanylate cyclase/phosphodiesterase [Comamonadaceae bacterium]